jgi:hypothetical protein
MVPALRSVEARNFWPALLLTLVAAVLLSSGLRHVTTIETKDGDAARELQLIKSFSTGGLEVANAVTPPDPAAFDSPEAAAAALERYAEARRQPFHIKYHVNTDAADPCPT